jgi:hypothetical protein
MSLTAGIASLALIGGGVLWWFSRQDISTRLVCTAGQICTEYFSLKDGLPVRSVCPSEGREKYPLRPGCTRVGGECTCR